jgi:hypothetical protein
MYRDELSGRRDHVAAGIIAAIIIVNSFLYLLARDQTFVHIDAIAHVNKGRGLFDNLTPGIRQLGTVWLPLPHILIAPLAAIDMWWRNGAAGSLVSIASFIGVCIFLVRTGYEWTGSRIVGWMAFLFFALNPRLVYLFTTPMTEPLMIFCASGLLYYLMRWSQDEEWRDFGLAGLMAFAGTLTRYEGWALAAAAALMVPVLARKQRVASTILFAGAACAGPMLWMLFNMIYFDDPIMFAYGIGSAQVNETGKRFGTGGSWPDSISRYFIDVSYALNPGVIWLGLAGVALSLILVGRRYWRPTFVLAGGAAVLFFFYALNLYLDNVSILLPGLVKDDPQSTYNVRYGAMMATSIPLFAALFVFIVWRQVDRHRAFSLFLLAPLFLPDPIPQASNEPIDRQLTHNLFYTEALHNQSFWMPPFVEVSQQIRGDGLILTNTRIQHVVVWTVTIPMRQFVTEMHDGIFGPNLNHIGPNIEWVITEEGDQLWHARGEFLQQNWVEVASAKGISTGTVHLYRRPR